VTRPKKQCIGEGWQQSPKKLKKNLGLPAMPTAAEEFVTPGGGSTSPPPSIVKLWIFLLDQVHGGSFLFFFLSPLLL